MTKQEYLTKHTGNGDTARKDLDELLERGTCEWKVSEPLMDYEFGEYTWKPGCNEGDGWEYPQGEAFTDEIVGYIYCPHCGRKIERV